MKKTARFETRISPEAKERWDAKRKELGFGSLSAFVESTVEETYFQVGAGAPNDPTGHPGPVGPTGATFPPTDPDEIAALHAQGIGWTGSNVEDAKAQVFASLPTPAERREFKGPDTKPVKAPKKGKFGSHGVSGATGAVAQPQQMTVPGVDTKRCENYASHRSGVFCKSCKRVIR